MILQILNSSEGKKASTNEIFDKIYFALDERTKDKDIASSIKRVLKEMQKLGVIRFLKKERVYVLSNTIEDLFSDFSMDELKDVYLSVLFFINTNVPNVPGWFLKESLEKYLLKKGEKEFVENANQLFWFTYVPHHYILDEELVWKFWQAASERKKIKVWYYPRNKGEKQEYDRCIPLRIIYDVKLGRWYFIVIFNQAINAFPAARVEGIEILDEVFDENVFKEYWNDIEKCFFVSVPRKMGKESAKGLRLKKVKLRFIFDDNENETCDFLLKRVVRELKNPKIEKVNQKEFVVEYEVSNIKEFKPWVRSFSHRVVVEDSSEDSKKLQQEIINDLKEILRNYGSVQ